jgi:hypothetical protein
MKPGVGENPVHLSPVALHNMLKSALKPDEPDDVLEGGS